MKKLIIHINKDCVFTQQEQCEYAIHMLPKYLEAKGDKNTLITAYWETNPTYGDHVILCRHRKSVAIYGWQNRPNDYGYEIKSQPTRNGLKQPNSKV